MTISISELRALMTGHELPGGAIVIQPHESTIGDGAIRAMDEPRGLAHPLWFIIASLRGMGITVDELCALAHQDHGDTLLFGSCEVVQDLPLVPGATYTTTARIGEVGTRKIGDGSRLDSIEVVVKLTREGAAVGVVSSTYLLKRARRG